MKRLLILILSAFMTLILAKPVHAGANISKLVRLDGITTESGGEGERVEVKFAKAWNHKPRPTFYPKSIQMDVEGAYITPAKREFKLKSKLFTNATLAQVAPNTVRVRLFMKADPRDYSGNWSGSVSGSTMSLIIDKHSVADEEEKSAATVKEKVTAAVPSKETLSVKTSADEVLEKVGIAAATGDNENAALEKVTPGLDKAKVADAQPASEKPASQPGADVQRSFGFLAKPAVAAEKTGAYTTTQGNAAPKNFLNYEEPKAPEAPSMSGMVIKMISSLALVLALVFALSWIAKRYMGKFGGAFGGSSVVKILATGSIGMKKQIAVVDVAGEVIVVGISGDNITMLTTIEDQETADRLKRSGGGNGRNGAASMADGYMKTQPASPIRKALDALRIGKIKTKSPIPPALIDEADPDTFAGSLAGLTGMAAASKYSANAPSGRIETKGDESRAASREELLRRVTGAIRAKNGSMKLA